MELIEVAFVVIVTIAIFWLFAQWLGRKMNPTAYTMIVVVKDKGQEKQYHMHVYDIDNTVTKYVFTCMDDNGKKALVEIKHRDLVSVTPVVTPVEDSGYYRLCKKLEYVFKEKFIMPTNDTDDSLQAL